MEAPLSEQLIDIRRRTGVPQRFLADMAGVALTSYQGVESGSVTENAPTAKILKKKIIGNEKAIRQKELEIKRAMDKNRIQNVPEFYEVLHEIERKNGSLMKTKVDDPLLHKLQALIGVEPIDHPTWGVKGVKKHTLAERKEFVKLLRQYRGDIPMAEFARRLDVLPTSYRPVEGLNRGTGSAIVQNIIQNSYFTDEQQKELTKAYKQMQKKEKEVRR